MWHHKKLIITYYALNNLSAKDLTARFSKKARGSFDAGYPV